MYVNFDTDRLNVSPLTINDCDFMADLVNSEGWLKYIGDRNVHNTEQALAYVQMVLDKPFCFYNVIRLKGTAEPIGIISFIKRETQKFYDIGFALLQKYEGRGYSFEATSKYLALIRESNKHREVVAITLRGNTRSISLLTKLGLKFSEHLADNGEELSLYSIKFP